MFERKPNWMAKPLSRLWCSSSTLGSFFRWPSSSSHKCWDQTLYRRSSFQPYRKAFFQSWSKLHDHRILFIHFFFYIPTQMYCPQYCWWNPYRDSITHSIVSSLVKNKCKHDNMYPCIWDRDSPSTWNKYSSFYKLTTLASDLENVIHISATFHTAANRSNACLRHQKKTFWFTINKWMNG